MADRYAQLMRRLQESVLYGNGQLDPAVREALASVAVVPEPLASYAEKVRRYAYKVTDEDIQALQAVGYSQDQILEATLSIALGAAQMRLDAGLRALDEAGEAGEVSQVSVEASDGDAHSESGMNR